MMRVANTDKFSCTATKNISSSNLSVVKASPYFTLDANSSTAAMTYHKSGGQEVRFGINGAQDVVWLWNVGSTLYPNSTLSIKKNNYVTQVSLTTTSTSWISSSDGQLKDVQHVLSGCREKLALIQPVCYKWKETYDSSDQTCHLGVIAQEVQQQFPEVVFAHTEEESGEERLGVEYSSLVAPLIACCNELSTALTRLEARVAALEAAP